MRASHVPRFVRTGLTVAMLAAPAPAALAQTPPAAADVGFVPAAPAPAPQAGSAADPALSFRVFLHAGYTGFTASDTFDAVLGSPTGPVYGGGVQVVHRQGYFFQVDASRFSDDGERVFVSDGEVFPLGIPLSVKVTPIEFTGGYRFGSKRRAAAPAPPPPPPPPRPIFKPAIPRPEEEAPAPPPPPPAPAASRPSRGWAPYVGGGIGLVQYEETADFAEAGDDVKETFTSYHVLGGIDIPLGSWLAFGAEVNYRWVPDALGEGGASREFGETDLGGYTLRARFIVGR